MTTIHKYQIGIRPIQMVSLPEGSQILSAQFQAGVLCLWAVVNPNAMKSPRTIRVFGTGHQLVSSVNLRHISTVQQENVGLVWHVFEEESK